MIVLDTNVLSEVLKPAPAHRVLRWLAAQAPEDMFTTTITLTEILYGLEVLPAGKRRLQLLTAVEKMFAEQFDGRILSFDEEAARLFGSKLAGWVSCCLGKRRACFWISWSSGICCAPCSYCS